MPHAAYLGLGTNLGDRMANLRTAATRIAETPHTTIEACSPLYETKPVGGPPDQADYLNAVVHVSTRQDSRELLERCHEIERSLGRQRLLTDGPRTIDIDLLLYDDLVETIEGLVIPHPRLHLRRFVLQPLSDLAFDLLLPLVGETVGDLLSRLADPAPDSVRRIRDAGWRTPG
ncbi:MAG: 2-amino-4-hydroxy-6-hydroxymethyldihydropteridine diphosphokinase [bacterium]|nr:2-amino-4-hydroxy-6-hydroxymethyldihydropteridine diphosphokinase [bacterium]